MTILILFHLGHYRTFKDYYHECVVKHLTPYFPEFLSYNRFLEVKSFVIPGLAVYMKHNAGTKTGRSSMGWFFGFKLYLVINHQGEIMSFCLTAGNVDDRKSMETLFKGLKNWMCG